MIYSVPLTRTPVIKTDPAGACIYCGKHPPEVTLTDEHIIADGLGGDLILDKGSCVGCAKIINPRETTVMTNIFGHALGRYDVHSRKRSGTRMMRAKDSATGETIELPVRGGPPLIFSVPVAGIGPGIIRHASPGERGVVGLYQVRPEYTEEDMKPPTLNPDQKITWTTKVDVQAFGQVLAKTAHAFAVACLGQGAFQPLLLDYILGDEVGFNTYLIGDAGPQPPIGKLHQLSMKGVVPLDAKGRRQSPLGLYAVEVRLFAHLPTPTYLVVVGQRLPSVSSPLWSGRVRV